MSSIDLQQAFNEVLSHTVKDYFTAYPLLTPIITFYYQNKFSDTVEKQNLKNVDDIFKYLDGIKDQEFKPILSSITPSSIRYPFNTPDSNVRYLSSNPSLLGFNLNSTSSPDVFVKNNLTMENL